MVKHEIKKMTHYEYWPYLLFYMPMIPFWFYFSLKARSFTYFTAVNPGIRYGGFFEYSKFKIQEQIKSYWRPNHIILESNLTTSEVPFNYPFIAKPDQGERGKDVQIIENLNQWEIYLIRIKERIIVQEFIDLPEEFGIFYAKSKDSLIGEVLSITGKKLLTFIGDGKISLRQFIESDSRAYFNKSYLYMKYHHILDLVLPAGEELILERIGNHNRGTFFYNLTDKISNELNTSIHNAVSNIKGFNYGRLDVKAINFNELLKGNFKILEVNGANSEPTHVYDPNFNLFTAYKEVYRHLKVQYEIAQEQIKIGHKSAPLFPFIKVLFKHLFS